MTYTRITTSSHSDRNSTDAALNHAGTKIVFSSDSDLLGEGIGSGQEQIWLYDTAAMTYTRITTSSHSNRASWDPAINGDGSKVVFTSDSDLLGEGIGDNQFQVWLYDTAAMTYTRITTSSHSDRYSLDPTIDTSGTKILFRSDSDLLGEGVASKTFHIWLYDTTTMTYTRITTLPDGFEESVGISISQDGTKITFGSNAYLLGGGTGLGPRQIWLWDVAHYVYLPVTVK